MKPKQLIPLVVVLAVLAVVAVVMKGQDKAPDILEQVGLESLVPDGLKEKDIARLELFAGAKPEEKVVLERDGDVWRVASRFNAPVKEDTIDEYLEKVVALQGELRERGADDARLEPYNLKDDQAFRVQAYKSSGDEPVMDILVGKAPDHKTVFMRQAGDNRVFVEGANLRQDAGVYGDETDKAPTADKWLNKDILKLDKEKITKVDLTLPDKKLVFEKIAKEVPQPEKEEAAEESDDAQDAEEEAPEPEPVIEYEWQLTAGGPGKPHKQPGLDTLLGKLAAFTANDVADPEKKADWGLEAPAFKAVISVDGEEDIVVEGGRPDLSGDGYVRVASGEEDVVYEVSKYNFEKFFPKGPDLFDLPNLTLDKKKIARIEINQPEGRVVLAKEGEEWTVAEPAAALKVQKSALTTLESTIANWKAADYADADAKTGAFGRTVTITGENINRTLAVADDSTNIDGVYAKLDGGDVLTMNRGDLKKLFLTPRDVYELSLLDFDENEAQSLQVTHGGATVTLAREGEGWSITVPSGETQNGVKEKCEDLLSALTEFEAKDFRLGAAVDSVQPATVLAVTMKDGASHTLNLSAEQDGLSLVTVSGMGTVFEADKGAVDKLIKELTAAKKPEEPEPAEEEAPAEDAAAPAEEAAAGSEARAEGSEAKADAPAPITVPIEITQPEGSDEKKQDTPVEVVVAPSPQ